MRFHELAEIFPLIEGAEFDDLVASIRENGQREPIVTYEDTILDGRNRFRACEAANVEPRFEPYTGSDPVRFVMDINLRRRHLNEAQRGMIGARLETMEWGTNQYVTKEMPIGTSSPSAPVSREKAAEMVNVSERTVARAKLVLQEGTPEEIKAADHGTSSLTALAEKIAKRRPPQKIPEAPRSKRAENTRVRVQLWAQLSGAFDNIRNLPRPEDVAAQMRAHGVARHINGDLARTLRWLEEFSHAWNGEQAPHRNGHDHAGDGERIAGGEQDQPAAE
jgi:hypothetical protein